MINHLPAHQDIVYFIEVSQTHNLSRAAERLGLTQPTLTTSLKRLEHAVGTQLLLRDKTGVRLTSSGEVFLKHARGLLEQWNHLQAQALRAQNKPFGRYRLAAHISVALFSWTQISKKLLESFPDIEIEFVHDLSRKITNQVIESTVDFAVAINPTPHPELVLKKLASDQVRLYISSQKSCLEHVLIYDPEMLQAQSIVKKMRSHPFLKNVFSSNLEVIADLTEQGAGVGILPGRVARHSVHSRLKLLPGQWPHYNDEIYFIYRKDRQNTEAGRALAQQIYTELQKVFNS